MTAVKAAGYSSQPAGRAGFDAHNPSVAPLDPLAGGSTLSAEEQARDAERRVHVLLEESAEACAAGQVELALEKAREAGKRERALCKLKEAHGMADQANLELTFAVCFNLAHMYHANKLFSEALNVYSSVVKNRQFAHAGRLRVNMGNVYFEQKRYPAAIKMYRMALDQVPSSSRETRFRIMGNIGTAFVRMGQYQDAIQAYETVVENMPDHQSGFNYLVCLYCVGDLERLKPAFVSLLATEDDGLSLPVPGDDGEGTATDAGMVPSEGFRREARRRRARVDRFVTLAGRLVAPVVNRASPLQGYDWVVEQLHRQGFSHLGNELEMAKAMHFMANKEFDAAIAVLKEFERKEHSLKAKAATNLAFLYFLEGDVENSEAYADLAVRTDRYNARGLVNRGNVFYAKGYFEEAHTMYLEAIGMEADCFEAIYNLGLANRRLGQAKDALNAFRKLHTLMPQSLEVVFQVADTYEAMGDSEEAVKWFEILNTRVPHDPGVLARLGSIHARLDDEPKALHYYSESHRVFPVSMDVISWLGAFYVKSEMYEKAVPFFALAAQVQPQEVKWQLMVASCHRRVGAYSQALEKYVGIHKAHPHNVECLKYIVAIYTDLGRTEEVQAYMTKLRKAERSQAAVAAATRTAAPRGMLAGDENARPAALPEEPDSPFQAPTKAKSKIVQAKAARPMEDDEWGSEELGDDLLPM